MALKLLKVLFQNKKVRRVIGIAAAAALAGMLLFITAYAVNRIPYNEIAVTIDECEVEDFSQHHLDIASTMGFEPPKDIDENMDKYSVVRLNYNVRNNSDKIRMNDMRCHPSFGSELKDNVVSYNSGNGTYYIMNEPKTGAHISQYIILDKDGMTNEEIYELVCGEDIKVTFYIDGFAGMFLRNTGHGYAGLGKYSYTFKISDCMV